VQVRVLSINVPSRRITASIIKATEGGNPEVAEFMASQEAAEGSTGEQSLESGGVEPAQSTSDAPADAPEPAASPSEESTS
jgi:hypothetical protein